jgi:hypothetical protein
VDVAAPTFDFVLRMKREFLRDNLEAPHHADIVGTFEPLRKS